MGRRHHGGAYRVWPDNDDQSSEQSTMKPHHQRPHKSSLAELRTDGRRFNDLTVCCVHGRPCPKATKPPSRVSAPRSPRQSPPRRRGNASNITSRTSSSSSSFKHVGENKNGYIDLSVFASGAGSRSRTTSSERRGGSSLARSSRRSITSFNRKDLNYSTDDERTIPYARRQTTYEALLNLPNADRLALGRCPKVQRDEDDDVIYENVPDTTSLSNFPWKGFDRYNSEKYKLLVNYYLGEMTREKAERFCGELGSFKLYHRLPSAHSKPVMLLPLFIVYRTSRGRMCHYRILPVDSSGDLRVDLPNQQTFSSLSQLVFHYSTYAACDNDGFADSFPWWTAKNNGSTRSNSYK